MLERMLSMHKVTVSVPAFSNSNMVALIGQLVESQNEDKSIIHVKALCLIHGQSNFTNFNSSTEKIPFYPTHNQYPPKNILINYTIIIVSP